MSPLSKRFLPVATALAGLGIGWSLLAPSPAHQFDKDLARALSEDVTESMRAQNKIISEHRSRVENLKETIRKEANPHSIALVISLLYEIDPVAAVSAAKDKAESLRGDKAELLMRLPSDLVERIKEN